MFKALKPLVMMQLKDKIDLSYLKNTKKAITKIVFTIFGFAAITAFIVGLLFAGKFLKIFHLAGIIPVSVMIVIFTIMEILDLMTREESLKPNCLLQNKDFLYIPPTNLRS